MNIDDKNNQQRTKNTKLEITSDNILHCLMHAATREDIADLRHEMKQDIIRLDDKIERLSEKINLFESRVDKKLNKYFTWIVGLMFGSFGGIAIMILKFPMLTH